MGLQAFGYLGGLADANHQDSRSQGVQGAGMADLQVSKVVCLLEEEFDLAHYVSRSPSVGLVEAYQYAVGIFRRIAGGTPEVLVDEQRAAHYLQGILSMRLWCLPPSKVAFR